MNPSIGTLVAASYYSFFWMVVLTSIIGTLIVASIDNAKPPSGRIVTQH